MLVCDLRHRFSSHAHLQHPPLLVHVKGSEQVPQHSMLWLRRALPQARALLAKRHRLEQRRHVGGRQHARHIA
jgi:hypothetical protein